jgi:hypothetical protein
MQRRGEAVKHTGGGDAHMGAATTQRRGEAAKHTGGGGAHGRRRRIDGGAATQRREVTTQRKEATTQTREGGDADTGAWRG